MASRKEQKERLRVAGSTQPQLFALLMVAAGLVVVGCVRPWRRPAPPTAAAPLG